MHDVASLAPPLMGTPRVRTRRLELRPLPARAAAALSTDRDEARRVIGAPLHDEWPQPDLRNVLPRQAAATSDTEQFGIWVMIESDADIVVGDVGFHGPPERGTIEIGYCVVPSRRRRGYATEAARAIAEWATRQDDVTVVVAGCAPDNTRSIRTLERAGFDQTGEVAGELRWRYAGAPAPR